MTQLVGDAGIRGLNIDSIPVIANGDVRNARIPVRASAIPLNYHWVKIPGLPVVDCMNNTNAFIRATYAHLARSAIGVENVSRVANAAVELPIANAVFAPDNGAITWANAKTILRTEAIILGTMRAVAYHIWALTDATLIDAECVNSNAITYAANRVTTRIDVTTVNSTLECNLAHGFAALDETEQEACFYLLKFAMAAVPLAGLSLFSTGHHFLSNSKLAQNAVMKQLKSEMPQLVRAWFDTRSEVLDDLIWHKSMHPVTVDHLKNQATSVNVPDILRRSGLGSAAVRLPYVENEVKAAEAMLAIVREVQEPVRASEGTLVLRTLSDAVNLVRGVPHGVLAAAPYAQFPTVVDRASAIREILIPATQRSEVAAAYAYGIFKGMLESVGGGTTRSSLVEARSLKRISEDHIASVSSGKAFYENYMKVLKNNASAGNIIGPTLDV